MGFWAKQGQSQNAFSASLVTVSNVSFMQTSVLDNHFQTPSYFLYSWGLSRGENGLWVQSWDRWERKSRNWCGFDIWNVALEAFRMQLGKSAKTNSVRGFKYTFFY